MGIVSPNDQVCRRPCLTSIPLEVRLMVYEDVFEGKLYDCFSYHVMYFYRGLDLIPDRATDWTSPLQLLLVCKQIHDEVATGLYKKITLEFDLRRWISVLNKIGPRYGSLIQQVEIVHQCWECHCRKGPNGAMWDCVMESPGTLSNPGHLLNCLAVNNVNPEYLKITTYSFLSFPTTVDHSASEDDDPIPETSDVATKKHNCSSHQLYHDQEFINQLTCISKNARRIDFHGNFNPLWALDLNKKLGFVIRLDYPFEDVNALTPSCTWMLMNPKSVDLGTEFQSYQLSKSNNRVYIKLPDYLSYAIERERLITGYHKMAEKGEDNAADDQSSSQSWDFRSYPWLLLKLIRHRNSRGIAN
ncbi:hypothetical protein F5B19DRAFT_504815 [Rostrohypoxylon terebratum]|nr:hypothetical protein F5B19DRAFT_504815 [Rostrohypoxylon terebratum]